MHRLELPAPHAVPFAVGDVDELVEGVPVRELRARQRPDRVERPGAVKAATGRTAAQLVREARTREAKRFLLRTDLTVRQVASWVGFADPAYFCRFFRRETGSSPGDFRQGRGFSQPIPADATRRVTARPHRRRPEWVIQDLRRPE